MATINVRRLADDVVDRLKLRASSHNRSLEDEARHILERAANDDFEAKQVAFHKISDRLRKMTSGTKQSPSEDLIREDRDHNHR